MAIIYSYPDNENLLLTDMLIGTSTIRINGRKKNITKNFTLEALGLFIQDNFPANTVQWGNITGTLSNQTDLQEALDEKQANITLTTTGTSGLATFIGSTLNIPDYGSGYVTPTLQSVTDEGNITTTTVYLNGAAVSESINEQAIFQPDSISTVNLNSGSGATLDSTGKVGLSPDGVSYSTFAADNITQSITLQAPNKAAGAYTIATTDDTTLQGVVDNGNTVTGTGGYKSTLDGGDFFVENTILGTKLRITGDGIIYFTNLAGNTTQLSNYGITGSSVNFQFPNKASGPVYTLATTADIPSLAGYAKLTQLGIQTLAFASWSLSGGYYIYTFSNVNITATSVVDFTPDNASVNEVSSCRMLPQVDVASGNCTFYATFPPQSNITGTINVWQ